MVDIAAGLAAVGQALSIAKTLREMEKSVSEAEFKLQIADLYTSLSDAKIALADAREALQAKDAEIGKLKSVADNRVKTIRVGQFNYGMGSDGRPFSLPFCPACEQTNGMQVPISRGIGGHNICPKCKGVYSARDTMLPMGFTVPSDANG